MTILVDGECPLCAREARFMQRLDGGKGRLNVLDITAADFDPAKFGLTMTDVMGQIHGITHDGRVVKGLEVFRRVYGVLGWGWLLAPTGWPGLRWVFDKLYLWFARNRRWLTGAEKKDCGDRCRIN